MLSPRQTLEDNMRPAQLLLQVYRLLDSHDQILTEGELVDALRQVAEAAVDEEVMVVYNEIFLGLVRERANMPKSTLRRAMLSNLLRQAVVASCTALETFLPALLRANLPLVMQVRGRDVVPSGDPGIVEFFTELQFSLDETLRLISDPNWSIYIASKILGLTSFKYLSSRKGIHVVGVLLGLESPWRRISGQLNRDKRELMTVLESAVDRRNDIVHRADRTRTEPDGKPQEISYVWAKQAVDIIHQVCLALDDLVGEQMRQYAQLVT